MARPRSSVHAVIEASRDARKINEQRAHDDPLAGLRDVFSPDELEQLFADGAALSDEDAARIAVEG